jgi:hypothetical protein
MTHPPLPYTPRASLTPHLVQRILTDLVDALDRDMLVERTTRSPAGTLYYVTSRTRPGHTHQVCRLAPTPSQPYYSYACNCEHGAKLDRFTPTNRHAHCWHARFVHFLMLKPPERDRIFTHATRNPHITALQQALRHAWHAYLRRRRAEMRQPRAARPGAPFIYALALAYYRSGTQRPLPPGSRP